MKIVLATENKHKIEEMKTYLNNLPLEILSKEHFPKITLEETGETLRENALQKARTVAKTTGFWAMADDTGLFVEALDGRPGVFSSRYAGEKATYKENVEKLLKEMRDVPEKDRGAFFSCVLALVHPDGREVVVEGRLEGVIAKEQSGAKGFGYDPVFWLPDRDCTLAEISLEEKNKISHRGRALFKMKGILEGLIKMEQQ
ncbi:MAG: non-canonical purine NTP pyrophosphatase, RdgB/HAM1 family [Deltaproteobacteria bacterium RIFCSPLOWO2_12_FULL_44_12]|nr:MAG: non-canonical purine NTP pyrophosphatase, RdgB/HAM1 family [Deltaproteobacteria bacterium RIFCSPHIGHO2_01_FULL_43_49]OGQ15913.1 MAG: non-canonical purine NTP pyrophosphatase, RdgB/HAM1 family [Deltaproteobacteria bacterium RIFCSPHIGHO2_02_FULL_44_53]OGQ28876.1 MAG: non-canonical purine NTP pyrophosphatase, RdgB/HAM1 family [Deltaproteobacteria bacterium RIFCSPHIGHO2_12_FULL_44_21]OGQ30968.1 MAG: non-canonical purine NTP pyrophosphatase, RdgB/HAM1 family [Deltaproteobacteria bacterium RIF